MECVALDVERLHLGIADFDTLFVGGGVERAFGLQAGLGGRRRQSTSTTAMRSTRGRPRQFQQTSFEHLRDKSGWTRPPIWRLSGLGRIGD
jgi:hypothetical protein